MIFQTAGKIVVASWPALVGREGAIMLFGRCGSFWMRKKDEMHIPRGSTVGLFIPLAGFQRRNDSVFGTKEIFYIQVEVEGADSHRPRSPRVAVIILFQTSFFHGQTKSLTNLTQSV